MRQGLNGKRRMNTFWRGLLSGAMATTVVAIIAVYALNILGLVAISVKNVPTLQLLLAWAYDNLGLSVIPFAAILTLYVHSLRKLSRLLTEPDATPVQLAQTERWVDLSASLFFGVGVIWTAIGMRGALLFALNDLDAVSAAQLGAFGILGRLVDGGILLALSTTIFGGTGGYLMRVGKAAFVGTSLQQYYSRLTASETDKFNDSLYNIEQGIARIAAHDSDPASAHPVTEP